MRFFRRCRPRDRLLPRRPALRSPATAATAWPRSPRSGSTRTGSRVRPVADTRRMGMSLDALCGRAGAPPPRRPPRPRRRPPLTSRAPPPRRARIPPWVGVAPPSSRPVTPYPPKGSPTASHSGVATYAAHLARRARRQGADVAVLAPPRTASPAAPPTGRAPSAAVRAGGRARAAQGRAAPRQRRAVGAPPARDVPYGGPASVPALAPALRALRARARPGGDDAPRRRPGGRWTRDFGALHRVQAPPAARAPRPRLGAARDRPPRRARWSCTSRASAASCRGRDVVPHGVERVEPRSRRRPGAPGAASTTAGSSCSASASSRPTRASRPRSAAAALAGDDVHLVDRRRRAPAPGRGRPARACASARRPAPLHRLRRRRGRRATGSPPPTSRCCPIRGRSPPAARWRSRSPHGTPVLLSTALARSAGAPDVLAVAAEPAALAGRLRQLAGQPARSRDLRGVARARRRPRWPAVAGAISSSTRRGPDDRSVLLAGAFGQRNPGDEALLERVRARSTAGTLVAATARPPGHRRRRTASRAVRADDCVAVARRSRAPTRVVFAGGTVFKTLHPACGRPPLALLRGARRARRGARAAAQAARARRRRRRRASTAAPRARSRAASCAAADLLVLRDEESADLLAGIGAPAPFCASAPTPAWTLMRPRRRAAGAAARRRGRAQPPRRRRATLADRLAAALDPRRGRRAASGCSRGSRRERPTTSSWPAVAARLDAPSSLDPPAELRDARATFAGQRPCSACASTRWSPRPRPACRSSGRRPRAKLEALARRLASPWSRRRPARRHRRRGARRARRPPRRRRAVARRERARRGGLPAAARTAQPRALGRGGRTSTGCALRPEGWVA